MLPPRGEPPPTGPREQRWKGAIRQEHPGGGSVIPKVIGSVASPIPVSTVPEVAVTREIPDRNGGGLDPPRTT